MGRIYLNGPVAMQFSAVVTSYPELSVSGQNLGVNGLLLRWLEWQFTLYGPSVKRFTVQVKIITVLIASEGVVNSAHFESFLSCGQSQYFSFHSRESGSCRQEVAQEEGRVLVTSTSKKANTCLYYCSAHCFSDLIERNFLFAIGFSVAQTTRATLCGSGILHHCRVPVVHL